ncbi:MAG: hypothetical protein AAF715_00855 [Myxococcota bacterium]
MNGAVAMSSHDAGPAPRVTPVVDRAVNLTAGAKRLTSEARATLRRLDEAARAFEAVFVRQLLESARFGPPGAQSAMGVDALAQGVTAAGGLGLASLIRDTMVAAELPELAASRPLRPTPGTG